MKAAELLGMSFRSFRYYVKKYNLAVTIYGGARSTTIIVRLTWIVRGSTPERDSCKWHNNR